MLWIIIGIIAFLLVCFRDDPWNTISILIGLAALVLLLALTNNIFVTLVILLIASVAIVLCVDDHTRDTLKKIGSESSKKQQKKSPIIVRPARFAAVLAICGVIIMSIAVPIFLNNSDSYIAKDYRYNRAVSLMKKGEYEKAGEIFSGLYELEWTGKYYKTIEHKDAYDLYQQCNQKDSWQSTLYRQALDQFQNGDYMYAKASFDSLGDYKDSAEYAETCAVKIDETYSRATAMMESKRYEAARVLFQSVISYQDSAERVLACNNAIADEQYGEMYKQALSMMQSGQYSKAIELFRETHGYKDSTTMITECETVMLDEKYENAIDMIASGQYIEAYESLKALNGYKDSTEKADSISEKYKIASLQFAEIGDTIKFGSYKQSAAQTAIPTNIEWIVLAKEENRILVVTKHAIDSKKYNDEDVNVSWESCALRTWLNTTFFETAFGPDEAAVIQISTILTENIISGRLLTEDKLFLLSGAEAEQYFSSDSSRICTPTRYAKLIGKVEGVDSCAWWLRTPGPSPRAYFVNRLGGIAQSSFSVDQEGVGVRPAMWLSIE